MKKPLFLISCLVIIAIGIYQIKPVREVLAEATSWVNSGSNMYANVSGNLGIGTTSPLFPLHLSKGAGKAAGFLNEATAANNDAFVTYKAAANTTGRRAFNFNTGFGSPDRLDLRLLNDNLNSITDTLMTWKYDGTVGIGTTNPIYTLDVNGTIWGEGLFSNFISTTEFYGNRLEFYKQSLTVASNGIGTAATATLTPSNSYVEITCNDPEGCNITLGESQALEGDILEIVNMSNIANFSDTSGVSELAGSAALGRWDSISLIYEGTRWIERSRSNN